MSLTPCYWHFRDWEQLSLLAQLWENLCALFSLHGMQVSSGWAKDRIEAEVENRLRVARLARCRRVRMEGYQLRRYTTAYRRARGPKPNPRLHNRDVEMQMLFMRPERKTYTRFVLHGLGEFVEAPPRVN